ncbi:hypothetical protein CPC08DRAFT_714030 [Agrocybe pediades]|nr:hypothetical protein CPC08DRAFT_714030 [Agrocybe pediades]
MHRSTAMRSDHSLTFPRSLNFSKCPLYLCRSPGIGHLRKLVQDMSKGDVQALGPRPNLSTAVNKDALENDVEFGHLILRVSTYSPCFSSASNSSSSF